MEQKLMNFFKCKHSVCAECGVHFEPVPKGTTDARWPNLCETHRAAPRAIYWRRQAVINWATTNFERLEKQMEAELEKARQEEASFRQRHMNSAMSAAQAQATYQYGLRNQP